MNKNKTYKLELITLGTKNAQSSGYRHEVDEIMVFNPETNTVTQPTNDADPNDNLSTYATGIVVKQDHRQNALRVMTDGVKTFKDLAAGSTDYGSVDFADSYDGASGKTEDFWGLTFDENYLFDKVIYTTGAIFPDGGWFIDDSLKVQVRKYGQWVDVTGLQVAPVYPYNNTAGPAISGDTELTGTSYTFTFNDTWGDAIRVYGTPYKHTNNLAFTSISELEVYYVDQDADTPGMPGTIEALSISGDDEVAVNDTIALSANVTPISAEGQMLIWETSDGTIATVNENGIVTGIKGGTVTITVSSEDGTATDTHNVTVITNSVEGVTIAGADEVKKGKTISLTANITPENASNQLVNWVSSDETVATVNDQGVVTGIELGTATITVTTVDGSKTAQHDVTVVVPTPVNAKNDDNIALTEGAALVSLGDQFNNALGQMTDENKNTANWNFATSLNESAQGREEDYWGLTFDNYYGFNKVVYTTGPMFPDGGWFIDNSLKVQVRQYAVWVDVTGLNVTPQYPYYNTAGPAANNTGTSYTFTFDDSWGDGIRIYGKPYKHSNDFTFTTIVEFEAYYTN
ncbi:Ig-like domain-containing protein [Paenibacillus chungangensis]|uniref:Ig domain-containing protein n=1 Tax=Paenibacillus chungangensis TaxID=696535 RepID=A0ABW3HTW6_9BACL